MSKQSGCLFGWLTNLFGGAGKPTPSGPVMPRVMVDKYFVTDAEAGFFRLLREVIGARGHVLAQVSLKQLLYFPKNQDSSLKKTWQNKTDRKAIDFVVCDPSTLRPLVAIELDEPSHTKPERQTRDDEVEVILRAAGLPLVHVLTSRMYETTELEEWLAPLLRRQTDRRGR